MTLDGVRALALALPEAIEADHHGFPSSRVRSKIFSTLRPETSRLMVKLDVEDQHNFCAACPDAIAPVPGSWGRRGATFVDVSAVDETTIATLLDLAWRRIAPKSLRGA